MADKIYEDEELIAKRFTCDCMYQGHNLDVSINTVGRECSFDLYMAGKASLRYRLGQAWKCLKGYDGQIADFILRPEDVPELIALLKKFK